jgi:hypothetical protein
MFIGIIIKYHIIDSKEKNTFNLTFQNAHMYIFIINKMHV